MKEKAFYANGLRFGCVRCSACCRFDPGTVSLSENDVQRLLEWSKLGRDAFVEAYCRWVPWPLPDGTPAERLCLKEKANYDCIFWDGGCTAYEARPLQCSSYPFWEGVLRDEDCWNAHAADCPGMNGGPLHSLAEIDAWLEKRRGEPFVTKRLAQTKDICKNQR